MYRLLSLKCIVASSFKISRFMAFTKIRLNAHARSWMQKITIFKYLFLKSSLIAIVKVSEVRLGKN